LWPPWKEHDQLVKPATITLQAAAAHYVRAALCNLLLLKKRHPGKAAYFNIGRDAAEKRRSELHTKGILDE